MNKLTILLAEDNDRNRFHLAAYLRTYGARVIEVEDGQEALDLVRAGEHFDVLVTDHQMPRLTGSELVEALRQDGYTQPMIVWTAFVPLPKCPGADCVVSKLNGLPAVAAAVQQCLKKSP